MTTRKIIACLDIKDGNVVKGINFVDINEVGNPVEFAKRYEAEGADELVLLDITATNENRKTGVMINQNCSLNVTPKYVYTNRSIIP